MTIFQENQMLITSVLAVLLILGVALARDKLTEKSRLTTKINSSLQLANQCREYNARSGHPQIDLSAQSVEALRQLALFYDNDILNCRGALHANSPN